MNQNKSYQDYLNSQKAHGLSGACDHKYLDYLFQKEKGLNFANAQILDVGCNKFLSFDYLKNKYPSCNPVGICVSQDGLKEAQAQKRHAFYLDAHFLKERFENDSFDLIISFHSFEHMYDLPLVIQNCYDVLKKSGYLYYSFPIPSHNNYYKHWFDIPNQQEALRLLIKPGFNNLWSEVSKCKFRPEQEIVGLLQK